MEYIELKDIPVAWGLAFVLFGMIIFLGIKFFFFDNEDDDDNEPTQFI